MAVIQLSKRDLSTACARYSALRHICFRRICEIRWYHESSRPYAGEGIFCVFKCKAEFVLKCFMEYNINKY